MGREGETHHFEAASLCDAAETDCERGARGCIGGSPAPYGHARALAYEHMPRAVGIVTGPGAASRAPQPGSAAGREPYGKSAPYRRTIQSAKTGSVIL